MSSRPRRRDVTVVPAQRLSWPVGPLLDLPSKLDGFRPSSVLSAVILDALRDRGPRLHRERLDHHRLHDPDLVAGHRRGVAVGPLTDRFEAAAQL